MGRLLLLTLGLITAAVQGEALLSVWNQYDARWYIGIAEHGYRFSINGKSALAFYPLYPLLIHVATVVRVPALPAAIAISNVAFAGALFYLYRWTAPFLGPRRARGAVWLLAFFPMAVFTFAPYTESLLLCCVLGAFVSARDGRPFRAGLFLAAAVLTRPTGMAAIPAIIALTGFPRLRDHLVQIGTVFAAVSGYALYLYGQHIGLLSTTLAQRAWHRSLAAPWTGFTASIGWFLGHRGWYLPWALENLLSISVVLTFLGLTAWAWGSLSRAERLYCVGFWALVLCTPAWLDGYYAPFSSVDRFVLVLFPLAGWAARRLPEVHWPVTLAGKVLLLTTATVVYLTGGWVG